jgi:hypothetical protein
MGATRPWCYSAFYGEVEMRIIGALFIFGLSYLIGSHDGVLGFLEAWAIIGIFVMVGVVIGLLLSTKPAIESGDINRAYNCMMLCSWSGFFAFGLVGALIANMII